MIRIAIVCMLALFITSSGYSGELYRSGDMIVSGMLEYNSRYSFEDSQDTLNYHGAYYAKVKLDRKVNPNLNLRLTLFPYTTSICEQYYEASGIDFRFHAEYRERLKKIGTLRLRLADLGRITVSRGLLYDEMEFDGIEAELKGNKAKLRVLFLPTGFMGDEDTFIFRLSSSKGNLGLTGMFDAYFSLYPVIVSFDFNIPVKKYLDIYNETAVLRNMDIDTVGGAGLLGMSFNHTGDSSILGLAVEARVYSENFNDSYVGNLDTVYHGIDAQDKSLNNWRNYLLYGGDQVGVSLKSNYKARIVNTDIIAGLVVFDWEYLSIRHASGTFYSRLFTIGCDFEYKENTNIFLGVSNKAMPGDTKYLSAGESMYGEHLHLLVKTNIRF